MPIEDLADLADFLLACITEDEVNATLRQWHHIDCEAVPDLGSDYTYPCDCGVPERMKAESEVKRRIVEMARPIAIAGGPGWTPESAAAEMGRLTALEWVLRDLTSIYADRPGYREEWRP